jgi:uncharacterized membrane protein (DUF106 family)
MFLKLKLILAAVGTALLGITSFILGGRLKQAHYDKQESTRLKDQIKKAKEAQNEANRKKSEATVNNIADKLNKL